MNARSSAAGLREIIDGRSLVVVAGGGGVGKTTVSASLGLAAAQHFDDDVLVVTIDPARRLSSALGIDIAGNTAVNVPIPGDGGVNFFAAMLDPGAAWDEMIRSEVSGEETDRIVNNPVYRQIADTFVHGNDYAALGWLDSALESGKYRLIIVDTPPSQNALAFFDAPSRVEELFTSPLMAWLTGGVGSQIGGAAAKTFASLADRVLGSEFFADVVEFFQLMSGVVPGMVERTSAVAARFAGDDAAFLAVTSPHADVVAELGRFSDELRSRGLSLDGIVVNGVEPDVFWQPKVQDVANRVATNTKSPLTVSATKLLGPGAEYVRERCQIANEQRDVLDSIPETVLAALPRVVHSPADLPGLVALGQMLLTDRLD